MSYLSLNNCDTNTTLTPSLSLYFFVHTSRYSFFNFSYFVLVTINCFTPLLLYMTCPSCIALYCYSFCLTNKCSTPLLLYKPCLSCISLYYYYSTEPIKSSTSLLLYITCPYFNASYCYSFCWLCLTSLLPLNLIFLL